MTDENFQKFIFGCPSLQELVIVNPYAMNNLTLSAPNIEKLSLILTNGHEWHNPELLYSPNLKNLSLEIKSGQLDIVDVSSVCNIYIQNLNFFMHHGDYVATINQVLVGRFEGIEVFQLSCDASKEFLHTIQNLQLLKCRWRRIVLELQDFCESCLLGVYHLMNSLKHLEELVIYTTEDFKASADLLRVEHPCSYVTPQLKTITMHGYERSWKSQLQVVQVLLKSAAALDKFVIVPLKCRWKEADEPDFVKHLSSFPKASPSAKELSSTEKFEFPQNRWRRIVLYLEWNGERCLEVIFKLMKNSINLEELTIYAGVSSGDCELLCPELTACVLPLLKTVSIHGNHGYKKWCEGQLQVIEFLLTNAVILEKLVITFGGNKLTVVEKFDLVKQVSRFTRASKTAAVIFT